MSNTYVSTDADAIMRAAGEAFDAFEKRERDNGESFLALKDDAPEWVRETIRDGVHDSARVLPDDYRYSFAREAFGAIHDAGGGFDDARSVMEEPDSYTAGVTKWLHSAAWRVDYISEALKEYGDFDGDGFRLLGAAQMMERREVFDAVWTAVAAHAEGTEDAENTEDAPGA